MTKHRIERRGRGMLAGLVVALLAAAVAAGCAARVDPTHADGGTRDGVSAPPDAPPGDGGTRACHATTDCRADERCVFGASTCGPAPEGQCFPAFPPCDEPLVLCGCDGVTFSGCGERPYAHAGPCGDIDGGAVGCASSSECGPGQECFFTVGCGPGARGTCGSPTDCAEILPYCGCDNATFMDCPGGRTTRPFAHEGACEGVDGGGGGATCTSSAECGGGMQCVFSEGCPRDTPAVGRCMPPMECFATVPFCGCDGTTFRDCPGAASRPYSHTGACTAPPLVDCDWRHVMCRSLPPRCGPGEVASVMSPCWGPCVPFAQCAPIACPPDGAPCPSGLRCDATTGRCVL